MEPTIGRTVEGHLDVPEPGAALARTGFRVVGWVHSPHVPVARVDVFLGGQWVGRAGLGRARPDVARCLGDPGAALSGFELRGAPGDIADAREAVLEVVVTLVDGTQEWLAKVGVQVPDGLAPPPPGPRAAAVPRPPAGRRPDRSADTTRLLWSARGLDQGGSQLRLAELIERLHGLGGYESTVIAPGDGPLRPRLEAAGATVRLTAPVPLDDIVGYEAAVADLGDWLEDRFDLAVAFSVTSFPAVDAATRRGVPAVLRIGEAAPLRTVVGWLYGELDPDVEHRARQAMAAGAAVVSNSHAAVGTYRSERYEGRFVVLPTGVDIVSTRPRELRGRLGIGPDERLLLCPASLWPVKGQAVLVAALGLVHRTHPNLGCVLVGHDDVGYGAPLAALVERYGLGDRVRIRPFEADLAAWWGCADVVVCASESEAMPAAVLEGMAHRLPVLACRVGDLPRLVEPGVNGWLCDHSDVSAMASALESVALASPEALDRMGSAAAAAVARAHDPVRATDRWVDLLRSAAGGP